MRPWFSTDGVRKSAVILATELMEAAVATDPGKDNVKAHLGFLAYRLAASQTPKEQEEAMTMAHNIEVSLHRHGGGGSGRYTYQFVDRMVKLERLQEQLHKIVESARQRFQNVAYTHPPKAQRQRRKPKRRSKMQTVHHEL